MAAEPLIANEKLRRLLLVAVTAVWMAVSVLAGCTPQGASQGPAETPTVTAQVSPSTEPSPTPVPGPVMAPVLPPEGAEFPDAILQLLAELELGGEPLVVSESVTIPALCDTPGSAGESTWSIARLSVGETPGDAGFCLLGSLPGTYTDDDGTATIEAGELLDDGRVGISSVEQLSSILEQGVVTYASNGTRYWVPVYVSFPDPQGIKDGIDEGRMIPVPDFCTQERPLLRWLVLDEEEKAFELDGDEYLDAVYRDTEIIVELQEGEHVAMDWETGTYVRVPSQGSREDLFAGLIVPEPPPMVDVATREEVEAWWQAYGVRDANGRVLEVRIEEEAYLDDEGNEVKTFKVVGSGGIVWMRVFANVPRQPTGTARLDLSFEEKVPDKLAVKYRAENDETTLTSLLFIPTADDERSGLRPILKAGNLSVMVDDPWEMFGDHTPPRAVVRPFLWKAGDHRTQQISYPCYYLDTDQLPRSLAEVQGQMFDHAWASWVPYVDGETLLLILEIAGSDQIKGPDACDLMASAIPYADHEAILQIVETWRASVRNEVPLDYIDGEYVPPEHRRDDWGDLPHNLVEQALDSLVEAVRRTPNLDAEKRGFLRDLVGEVRAVRIRGTWGSGPYLDECGPGCSTYDGSSETVYLAFYRGGGGVSQLRLSTELYRPQPTQANKSIACLPTLDMILHEGEHGVVHLSDLDAEHRVIYRKQVRFLNWLAQVFSAEFAQASPEVRDGVQDHIRLVGERAGQ